MRVQGRLHRRLGGSLTAPSIEVGQIALTQLGDREHLPMCGSYGLDLSDEPPQLRLGLSPREPFAAALGALRPDPPLDLGAVVAPLAVPAHLPRLVGSLEQRASAIASSRGHHASPPST